MGGAHQQTRITRQPKTNRGIHRLPIEYPNPQKGHCKSSRAARTLSKNHAPKSRHGNLSHKDTPWNNSNEEVDKLCDSKERRPNRPILERAGENTPSKIKEWMKNWLMYKRKSKLVNSTDFKSKDSVSRKYLIEILSNNTEVPREHRNQPRRVGILLSKARTNR